MDFDPKEAEMKYCGIDLHSNNSVVVVTDQEDRSVLQKRLPNDLGADSSGAGAVSRGRSELPTACDDRMRRDSLGLGAK